MEKYVFREQLERNRLKYRLGNLMDIHLLVNVEKLCRESGLPPNLVRSLVEEMVENKEAERLRPLDYNKDDMDFFRMSRRPRSAAGITGHRGRRHSWELWIGTINRAVKAPILGRRQKAYS